jgi:hypothetical protein
MVTENFVNELFNFVNYMFDFVNYVFLLLCTLRPLIHTVVLSIVCV